MEQTYNDILAENQRLKKEVRKLKRELATEHATAESWKNHYFTAKREVTEYKVDRRTWRNFVGEHFPEWLELFDAICRENESPKAVTNAGCKIISL